MTCQLDKRRRRERQADRDNGRIHRGMHKHVDGNPPRFLVGIAEKESDDEINEKMLKIQMSEGKDKRADRCSKNEAHFLLQAAVNDFPEDDFFQHRTDDSDCQQKQRRHPCDLDDTLGVCRLRRFAEYESIDQRCQNLQGEQCQNAADRP